jgi:hypothetical protein
MSFCTAVHHDAKRMSKDNLSWTNDGANGCDVQLTSQYYLLKWLSTGENYHNYRSPSGGRTKIDIANEVASYINSKGVKVTRTGETVQAKITWVQGCMREMYDFTVSPTGEGIQQNQGFDSLEEKVCHESFLRHHSSTLKSFSQLYHNKVKFRCPFYYELEEKFLSRAGIKPTRTSDEIFNSSSESSLSHVSNHSEDGDINGGSNGRNIESNIAGYSSKNRCRNNRQQPTEFCT